MLDRYPPAEVTSDEYERQIVEWLRSLESFDSIQVSHSEKIAGSAGEYTFDGVARFQLFGGAEFVVLIE